MEELACRYSHVCRELAKYWHVRAAAGGFSKQTEKVQVPPSQELLTSFRACAIRRTGLTGLHRRDPCNTPAYLMLFAISYTRGCRHLVIDQLTELGQAQIRLRVLFSVGVAVILNHGPQGLRHGVEQFLVGRWRDGALSIDTYALE